MWGNFEVGQMKITWNALGVFQALRYSCLAQSNFWKRVQRASQVAFARFQKWALRFTKLPLQSLTQFEQGCWQISSPEN
jgi:hypothetical protein